MIVKFKGSGIRYPDLTPGNLYRVIGIEADHYRLMNDIGRPFLYPPTLFDIVNAAEPKDWRSHRGEDGERYAYPEELAEPGFFESYFDGDRRAMATLHAYLLRSRSAGDRRRAAG
jgi:hypothetical protein